MKLKPSNPLPPHVELVEDFFLNKKKFMQGLFSCSVVFAVARKYLGVLKKEKWKVWSYGLDLIFFTWPSLAAI